MYLTSLFLLSTVKAVLAELQQANLISSEECEELQYSWLFDVTDVVRVQSGKSPEVMSITADVLRRHGFEKESTLLAGRQLRPSYICLCYVTLHYIHTHLETLAVTDHISVEHTTFFLPS